MSSWNYVLLNVLIIIIVPLVVALVIVGVVKVVRLRGANKLHAVDNGPKLITVPGYEEWEITTALTVLHIRDATVYFTDGSYINLATGDIRNMGNSVIHVYNRKTCKALT